MLWSRLGFCFMVNIRETVRVEVRGKFSVGPRVSGIIVRFQS